jgi:hypothetical protein
MILTYLVNPGEVIAIRLVTGLDKRHALGREDQRIIAQDIASLMAGINHNLEGSFSVLDRQGLEYVGFAFEMSDLLVNWLVGPDLGRRDNRLALIDKGLSNPLIGMVTVLVTYEQGIALANDPS